MQIVTIKLTQDQADDLIQTYSQLFYDHLDKDNHYAHFCHRIRMKVSRARSNKIVDKTAVKR